MRKKTQPAASRTYSIKTQSVTLLTSGLILLIALLLFSNLYGAFDSNKKIAASNERTLTYTAAQIEDNLSNVNNMMLSILSSNTGLQTLTAGTDSLNAHTVTQELVSQFQRLLRVYPFLFCLQHRQQQLPGPVPQLLPVRPEAQDPGVAGKYRPQRFGPLQRRLDHPRDRRGTLSDPLLRRSRHLFGSPLFLPLSGGCRSFSRR